MNGSEIVVTAPKPRGVFVEGTINDTSYPGTAMQIVSGQTFLGGEPYWQHYAPSADADPRLCAILLADTEQGQLYSTAYAVGARCQVYCPLAGEYVNVIVAPQQGSSSANAYTIGERLVPQHTTGQFIIESTSSIQAWFMSMEHYDAPADLIGWLWCQKQF